jgi:hypothetical protein
VKPTIKGLTGTAGLLGVSIMLLLASAGAGAGETVKKKSIRKSTLTLRLLDHQSKSPTVAMARLSRDQKTFLPPAAICNGQWFVLDTKAAFKLAPGDYRLQINGGPRRLPYDKMLTLSAANLLRTVYLRLPGHLFFELDNLLPVDPLFSAGSRPDSEALAVSRASGVTVTSLLRPDSLGAPENRDRHPLLTWRTVTDIALGSRCILSNPGTKDKPGSSISFFTDCGAPRSFNPWREVVPWQPELGKFYDMMPSYPRATRGIGPRIYFLLAAGENPGGFELNGSEKSLRMWMALLKAGYRIPAVAGSRGILSKGHLPRASMLVAPRLLKKSTARTNPTASETSEAVLASMAKGCSSISFGPYCWMTIDEARPGESLKAIEKIRTIKIRVATTTDRRAELSRIELYRGGVLLRSFKVPAKRTAMNLNYRLVQDEPTWFLLRCWQRRRRGGKLGGYLPGESISITNPIWIEAANYSLRPKAVSTLLKCRILSKASGKKVSAAHLSFTSGHVVSTKPQAGLTFAEGSYTCPLGECEVSLSPAARVTFSAPGYASHTINLFEKFGLQDFARKCAAMTPRQVEKYLCDPTTMTMLKQRMQRLELDIRLQKIKDD